MQAKFVIFVVISAFLVAGIYSTSASIVVAQEVNTTCQPIGKTKNQVRCQVADEDTNTATSWLCEKNSSGTWSCVEIKPLKEDSLPPGLKDALNEANFAELQTNTTGVNDTNIFDRLNDLTVMNEETIDSDENGDEESIDSDENGDENGDRPTINPEN